MALDEIAYRNTRTDSATYADRALDDLLTHALAGLSSARSQCYVRDAIEEAFEAGEHQGVTRAIRVLAIGLARTTDPAEQAALARCLRVLVPEE